MSGLLADAFGHDPSATAAFKALPTVSPREQVKGNLVVQLRDKHPEFQVLV